MVVVVSLRKVIDEMDVMFDEAQAYLNVRTGELITIRDEEISAVEDGYEPQDYSDWKVDMIEKTKEVLESEDFKPLPDKFEIHEYSIMERFCYLIADEELRDELLYQIRGSGAFRRFKDAIHRHNIADEWYQYRDRALEAIAIDWLEAHGVPYVKDTEAFK
jgi:hypothetical protein